LTRAVDHDPGWSGAGGPLRVVARAEGRGHRFGILSRDGRRLAIDGGRARCRIRPLGDGLSVRVGVGADAPVPLLSRLRRGGICGADVGRCCRGLGRDGVAGARLGRSGRIHGGTCFVAGGRLKHDVVILVEVCFWWIELRRCLVPIDEVSHLLRRMHRIRRGDAVRICVSDVHRRRGNGAPTGSHRGIGSCCVREARAI